MTEQNQSATATPAAAAAESRRRTAPASVGAAGAGKEPTTPIEPSATHSGAPGGDVTNRHAFGGPPLTAATAAADHPLDPPENQQAAVHGNAAASVLMVIKEGTNFKPFKTGDVVYLTPLQAQQWADRFDPAPPGAKPTPYPATQTLGGMQAARAGQVQPNAGTVPMKVREGKTFMNQKAGDVVQLTPQQASEWSDTFESV